MHLQYALSVGSAELFMKRVDLIGWKYGEAGERVIDLWRAGITVSLPQAPIRRLWQLGLNTGAIAASAGNLGFWVTMEGQKDDRGS